MKYLGGKDRAKKFIQECQDVGLDVRDVEIIKNIEKNPEWFTVLLSYSELGLLKRMGSSINKLKGIENGDKN